MKIMKLRSEALLILMLCSLAGCSKVNFGEAIDHSSAAKSTEGVSEADEDVVDENEIGDDDTTPPSTPPTFTQKSCDDYIAEFENVPAASGTVSIVNSVGARLIKANHIDRIEDSTGAFVVIGSGDDARIDKIIKHRGAMLLCNVDVGSMENSVGAVYVGGSIESIVHHYGAIVVTGSIGSVTDSFGAIGNVK